MPIFFLASQAPALPWVGAINFIKNLLRGYPLNTEAASSKASKQ
jgi:hypothetical protein